MNTLKLTKYRFTLHFKADTILPAFVGNTICGALGFALDNLGSPAYERMFKVDSVGSIPNPFMVFGPYPSKGLSAK